MHRKYEFDIKLFGKSYVKKALKVCLIIIVILNALIIAGGKWNVRIGLVLIIFCGLFSVVRIIQQCIFNKTAYIELYDSGIRYYRKIKEGHEDTTYEYEARMVDVYSIDQFTVNSDCIIIEGDIDMQIFYDASHKRVVRKKISQIKIPLYFKEQDELIEILKSRYEK